MNNKKSQITIFVLIGIVAIIGGLVFLSVKNSNVEFQMKTESEIINSIPDDFLNVYYSIQSGASDFLKESLKTTASHGGIVDWDFIDYSSSLEKFKVKYNNRYYLNYFYYNDDCEIELLFPNLDNNYGLSNDENIAKNDDNLQINKQLEMYFENAFVETIEKSLSYLATQGYYITIYSDPVANVYFKDNQTQLYFKMLTEIEYNDQKYNIDEYYVSIDYDFKQLYLSAVDVVNSSINQKIFENVALGYMQYALPSTFNMENQISIVLKSDLEEKTYKFLEYLDFVEVNNGLTNPLDLSLLEESSSAEDLLTLKAIENTKLNLNENYDKFLFDFNFIKEGGINFDLNNGKEVLISSPFDFQGESNVFSGLLSSLSSLFNFYQNERFYSFEIPIKAKVEDFSFLDSEEIEYEFFMKPKVRNNNICNKEISLSLDNIEEDPIFSYLDNPENRLVNSKEIIFNLKDNFGRSISQLNATLQCGEDYSYYFTINNAEPLKLPFCAMDGILSFNDLNNYIEPIYDFIVLDDGIDNSYDVTVYVPKEMTFNISNQKYSTLIKVSNFENYLYNISKNYILDEDVTNLCKFNGYPIIINKSNDIDLFSNIYLDFIEKNSESELEELLIKLDMNKYMDDISFFYIDCDSESNNDFNYFKLLNVTSYYNYSLYNSLNDYCNIEEVDCNNLTIFLKKTEEILRDNSHDFYNFPLEFLELQYDWAQEVSNEISEKSLSSDAICDYNRWEGNLPSITKNPMVCQYDYLNNVLYNVRDNIILEIKHNPVFENVFVSVVILNEDENVLVGINPKTLRYNLNTANSNFVSSFNVSPGNYIVNIITTYNDVLHLDKYCLKKASLFDKFVNLFTSLDTVTDGCLAFSPEMDIPNAVLGVNNFKLVVDEDILDKDYLEIPNFIENVPNNFDTFINIMEDLNNYSSTYGKLSLAYIKDLD